MPFHRIYAPDEVFTKEQKKALAKDITNFYVNVIGLPSFYVAIAFLPVPSDNMFIGGVTHAERAAAKAPFVRILIQHLGRMSSGQQERQKILSRIEEVYKPHVADRGLSWETQIEEPPADMWRYHGMSPPAPASKAEKLWKEKDEAVPFEGPTAASALQSGNYHVNFGI